MVIKLFKLIFLFSLTVLLFSCSSPGIKYVGLNKSSTIQSQSALNSDKLSYITNQFLIVNALNSKFNDSPEKVIELIAKHIENPANEAIYDEDNTRNTLYVLMELCMYQAKNSDKEETLKYWMSCCFYSYKYLFDKSVTPPIGQYYNVLGSRFGFLYYNHSLAQITKDLIKTKDLWNSGIILETVTGKVKFAKPQIDLLWPPQDFNEFLIAFDYIPVNFMSHSVNSGLGVPIIGAKTKESNYKQDKELSMVALSYPFTFVLNFDSFSFHGKNLTASPKFFDGFRDEFTEINDKKVPLSKDYTVFVSNAFNRKPYVNGIKYMFDPAKMGELQEIFMLSPYDPNKIPVVFTHGLMSKPQTWENIINTLLGNKTIRENYQFWFYSYPTGLPVLYSAHSFRKDLNAIKKKYDPENQNPKFKKAVLIGHSMGGVISRLAIQDSKGNYLLNEYLDLDKKIEDENLTKHQINFLKSIMVFKPLPYVKTAILIAAPHRGANMASFKFTRLGSAMISFPVSITHEAVSIMDNLGKKGKDQGSSFQESDFETGLDSLEPKSKFNKYTSNLPFAKNVKIYSIIGNTKGPGLKNGSDGIVPYKSSHLDNAQAELVIKGNHTSVLINPKTTKEITRILLENLRNQ